MVPRTQPSCPTAIPFYSGGKNSKNSRKGKHISRKNKAQDGNITRYTGPVQLPLGKLAEQVISTRLAQVIVVASGSTGIIFSGIANDPTTFQDWGNYTPLYASFRVLAVRAQWRPFDIGFDSFGGAVPRVQKPLIQWITREAPLVVPSSTIQAWDNDGAVVRNVGKEFGVTVRMSGQPEAQWRSTTSSPSFNMAIGLFGEGFSASTTYGELFCDCLVQFRARL